MLDFWDCGSLGLGVSRRFGWVRTAKTWRGETTTSVAPAQTADMSADQSTSTSTLVVHLGHRTMWPRPDPAQCHQVNGD